MRLWHKTLIPYLPNVWVQSQWRECIALKGLINKYGKPNAYQVDEIMNYPLRHFKEYTKIVYDELIKRGIKAKEKYLEEMNDWEHSNFKEDDNSYSLFKDWHNGRYLLQCLFNLQEKADYKRMSETEWNIIENRFSNLLKKGEN